MSIIEDTDRAEREDRTLFISGITEKVTDKLLYELFFQAGPIERVSIPKEKDGKNKTFGFVTYSHEASVNYALNIYAGTKLYGRELLLKYRNANKNNSSRNSFDNQSPMSSLVNPGFQAISPGFNMIPQQLAMQPLFTQDMFQQQLLQMATAPDFGLYNNFTSTRQDNVSQRDRSRDDRPDRNRHRREENRNNRSRPYRRSRSRSPQQRNNRDRSPAFRDSDRDRRRDNHRGNGGGGYSRWNY